MTRSQGPYRAPGEREPDEPEPDPRGPWVLQTWVSRRMCPDCDVSLFAARKEGFRIDACGRCGGAWLDHVVANRAIEERSLVPALLSDDASARAIAEAPDRTGRACPDCGGALVVTPVLDARVTIDVCDAHGAWFDPREMRAVIAAMVKRRPPPDDPEVDRAIAREARLGALRPPESYDVGYGISSGPGTEYYGSTLGELMVELFFPGRR